MADIADAMIDGEMDFFTGEYIGKGVGYPRTHDKSLPWERPFQWDRNHNINGVNVFLIKQGFNKGNHHKVAIEYAKHREWKDMKMKDICASIQLDWQSFKSWIIDNKQSVLSHLK